MSSEQRSASALSLPARQAAGCRPARRRAAAFGGGKGEGLARDQRSVLRRAGRQFWSRPPSRWPASIGSGGRLFTMGNGGSSCDASHVAVEFLHPVTAGRPALAAINLVADLAMISAVGNDVGFEHVFVRQVIAQARAGDGLIGISTSGNSANLIAAFAKAKEMGLVDHRPDRRRWRADEIVRRRRPLPGRAVRLDPPHPGMPRHAYHILWDLVHTLLADDRGSAAEQGSCGMKYVDEFRDRDKAAILIKEIEKLAAGDRDRQDAADPDHGGLRRPYAFDLPLRHRGHAAGRDRAGARAGLSGLRAADGARRRLHLDRRARRRSSSPPSATRCACPARRRACCRPRPTAPTSAWSIRRWTRSRSPARTRTARWCSSASASRPPCPRPR